MNNIIIRIYSVFYCVFEKELERKSWALFEMPHLEARQLQTLLLSFLSMCYYQKVKYSFRKVDSGRDVTPVRVPRVECDVTSSYGGLLPQTTQGITLSADFYGGETI